MSKVTPFQTSTRAVRRFLLEALGLTGLTPYAHDEPASLARVLKEVRRLECVQIDPVAVIERNQHLVLAARVPGYAPRTLERLLAQGRVFEYWANGASVIPMEDYPLFAGVRHWLRLSPRFESQFGRVADALLSRLAAEGPLPSRAFVSGRRVHGWWDSKAAKTKDTSHALNELWFAGQVMVVRRDGSERYFDLPEKVVPADVLRRARHMEPAAANAALLEKYMRAYRVFDIGDGFRFGWRKTKVVERRETIARSVQSGLIVPLQVDGVRRQYFVLAEDLDRLRRHEAPTRRARNAPDDRLRFLPPLDNLLWRRERLVDLFNFTYTWEIYVPAHKRRFGYYTMPILAGDQFIGRIDPRLDRDRNRLVLRLLRFEPGVRPTAALRRRVWQSLEAFAAFHGADGVEL